MPIDPSPFQSTPWTLLLEAKEGNGNASTDALNSLCQVYWPLVERLLRSSGVQAGEAEETTQAFFVEVVLARGLFNTATRERGRLRDLIRTSLRNFLIDRSRLAQVKRSPFAAVDDLALTLPPDSWDREWASSILSAALANTQAYFLRGAPHKWTLFESQVLSPIQSGIRPAPQQKAADLAGLPSAAAVASSLFEVRRRLRHEIHELVAISSAPEDQSAELRRLRSALSIQSPERTQTNV